MAFPGLGDTQLKTLAAKEPQWTLTQIRYGAEQQPIIIIDSFSPYFQDLIKDSQAQSFQAYGPHYPGVQAHAPADYLAPAQKSLSFILSDAFGYGTAEPELNMCMYSYVITPPENLSPTQRYPHYDGGDPRQVALLHYLCGETHGGTQFYRHNRTGFETLDQERQNEYSKARQEDLAEFGMRKPSYFEDTECGFTCLEYIKAKANRAILYPSSTIHSGDLGPSPQFSTKPENGRLTVNSFFVPT